MKMQILADADAVAYEAAKFIAAEARAAVKARGRFIIAVSGVHTPAHRRGAGSPQAAETQPELLAGHFSEAGLTEKAIGYWLKAGLRAPGRSANVEGIGYLTMGLALLGTLAESPGRDGQELRLLNPLGTAYIAARAYAAPEVGSVCRRMVRGVSVGRRQLTENPIDGDTAARHGGFRLGARAATIGDWMDWIRGLIDMNALGESIDVPNDLRAGSEVVGPLVSNRPRSAGSRTPAWQQGRTSGHRTEQSQYRPASSRRQAEISLAVGGDQPL